MLVIQKYTSVWTCIRYYIAYYLCIMSQKLLSYPLGLV